MSATTVYTFLRCLLVENIFILLGFISACPSVRSNQYEPFPYASVEASPTSCSASEEKTTVEKQTVDYGVGQKSTLRKKEQRSKLSVGNAKLKEIKYLQLCGHRLCYAE